MGKWTRRALLATGGLAGGALLVGVGVVAFAPNRLALRPDAAGGQLATWVRITPTGDVVAIVPHADLGQGTHTALAMMLAEELDADWSRVRVEEAPATDDYANGHVLRGFLGGALQLPRMLDRGADWSAFKLTQLLDFQITGGSVSVRGTGWYGLRIAGAAARDMLLRAAAARWSVPVTELTTADSRVIHAAGGRSAGFGEFIEAASQLEPPQRPTLKAPADYRIVGTPRNRFDVPAKVDGTAVYAADVRLPGMLHAALMAAPVFGGVLESVDAAPALARAGVRRVVELEQAVAVVAETRWQAEKALAALSPRFSTAGHESFASAIWFDQQQQALRTERGDEDHAVGDVEAALPGAARRIEAEYRVPYLYHATMEPMCATVRIADGSAEIWTGVQDPLQTRRRVAKVSGIDAERVTVHNHPSGGGFGRRMPHEGDYVEQATRIAMAMAPAPVKLMWSREQDLRHCYYRPAVSARFEGAVSEAGAPLAWLGRFTGRSEGPAARPLYAIPNQDIRSVPMRSHVPEGPWRSVAFSQHGFFVEAFFDELAHAAGADPLEFRLAHLGERPQHRAVLERLATLSGWRTTPRSSVDAATGLRRGRGVALVESFGSIVAEVCDVVVAADGSVRTERVVAVVDCGLVINPDTARAQVEGGILFGLSAALAEEITLESGAVMQQNFNDYPLLRLSESPAVEVEFIVSTAAPGGLGEPGTPPIAAALVNAVFAATGVRVRALPLAASAAALSAQPTAAA
jgi:isoquinoline 1-oxidoreductase beta subunit